MENILILDTETTGLDYKTCKILEIAVVFYNVKSRSIVHQVSTLLHADENPTFKINNIPLEVLKSVSDVNENASLHLIECLMTRCDAVIAHNARFDRNFIEAFQPLKELSKLKKWICSKEDIEWPVAGSLKLTSIAEQMGVSVISAHRALPDCTMLAECLGKLCDLESQLEKSTIEKDVYVANVSYNERNLAKEAGFHWNSIVPNAWAKRMLASEATRLRFSVFKQ